jgi:hypothetical protein
MISSRGFFLDPPRPQGQARRYSTLLPRLLFLLFLLPALIGAQTSASGPSAAAFRAAFSQAPLLQVTPAEFNRFVALHGAEGRLLAGPALAAAVNAQAAPAGDTAGAYPPACRDSGGLGRQACLDSLRQAAARDSLIRGNLQVTQGRAAPDAAAADEREERGGRSRGYIAEFFYDLGHGGGKEWDGRDWAAVIYVVVGVVVVGAFVVYGVQALYDLIVNKDRSPVFREFGLRFSYSGTSFRDRSGPALYRDAYLMGLRFAAGLDRGFLGLGLAAEGGYIDLALRGVDDPSQAFDFRGGYVVAGPMIRFGRNDPVSFNLEFLNGTSDHASIGWISKSRMACEYKFPTGLLLGANLGAVFYDLHFLDGLGLRSGSFNRDLSLITGLDVGWAF